MNLSLFKINSPLDRPQWLRRVTNNLGSEVMKAINNSSVVTTSGLFSLSLLTEVTQSLDSNVMKERIQMFIDLLKKNDIYEQVWLTEDNPENVISKTEDLGLINSQLIGNSKVFRPNENEAALLSYYQNNISHYFLLYSLICLSLKYVKKLKKKEIFRLSELVYPFLQADFYLPWENSQISTILDKCLKVLINLGFIVEEDDIYMRKPKKDVQKYHDFIALCNICESNVKRFYIVMSILWNEERMKADELQSRCIAIANKLQEIEGWIYTEFSDHTKFKIFIDNLLEDKYIKENSGNKLSASRITKRVQNDFEKFFNKDFMREVNQLNLIE